MNKSFKKLFIQLNNNAANSVYILKWKKNSYDFNYRNIIFDNLK